MEHTFHLTYGEFVSLYAFASIGVVAVCYHAGKAIEPYFMRLHSYVIRKGWL